MLPTPRAKEDFPPCAQAPQSDKQAKSPVNSRESLEPPNRAARAVAGGLSSPGQAGPFASFQHPVNRKSTKDQVQTNEQGHANRYAGSLTNCDSLLGRPPRENIITERW
ncbi:hypothetical protein NDU88_006453 [Pleurodeles waltl]|uniref:Uncharacterized protein n=1 Tax=Pleurodeles waltl TaxID=8319 RepID=A0AAV7NY52_PLEWA|nr:hypothetical protein NDU88_006453 [Pleurodeles waltl]